MHVLILVFIYPNTIVSIIKYCYTGRRRPPRDLLIYVEKKKKKKRYRRRRIEVMVLLIIILSIRSPNKILY